MRYSLQFRINFKAIPPIYHMNAIFPINNAARAEAFPLQPSLIFSHYYMRNFYFAMQASIASASFLPCKPREMMRPSGSKIMI